MKSQINAGDKLRLHVVEALGLCLFVVLCLPTLAAANSYTYNYVGNPFNSWPGGGACPPACNVTGWFTLAAPLEANFSGYLSPIAETLSSGGFTLTLSNTRPLGGIAVVGLTTDASGNIVNWFWQMNDVPVPSRIVTFGDGSLSYGDLRAAEPNRPFGPLVGSIFNDPGTWTEQTNVPEPSSLILLGIGMIAIVGLRRSKATTPV